MSISKTEIMERMLALVPSGLEVSEGSFIWDALSPMALELETAYGEIERAKEQSFINTAAGEYLDRGVAEMGLTRTSASFAIGEVTLNGTAGSVIASGTLLATASGTRFQTTEAVVIGTGGSVSAPIQAVVAGLDGNVAAGTITVIPVSVSGLASVTNAAATKGGEDEETDDDLRTRYFSEIRNRAESGNKSHYAAWADEYPGIGRYRIFPLWNGANTVKVSILDSANSAAGLELIAGFQEYLDPGSTGLGNGAAPIGAVITVTTAAEVSLVIEATVVLADGYTEVTGVQEAVESYLKDLAYSKYSVSYLGMAAKILSVDCVEQLISFTLNAGTADITLGAEEIPVLGSFACQAVTV